MKKVRYEFEYGIGPRILFQVDLDKYTPETALQTLNFFAWDWDQEEPPIDEVMKKYAIICFMIATSKQCNLLGVIPEFDNREGFDKIDGSSGILLLGVDPLELDEDELTMTIKED